MIITRAIVDRVSYKQYATAQPKISVRSQPSGVIDGETRLTDRVMMVPSLRRPMTRTMKRGS